MGPTRANECTLQQVPPSTARSLWWQRGLGFSHDGYGRWARCTNLRFTPAAIVIVPVGGLASIRTHALAGPVRCALVQHLQLSSRNNWSSLLICFYRQLEAIAQEGL
eukprot:scaffold339_cov402-Prasinococcus_capsulatus_cf.AAC.4